MCVYGFCVFTSLEFVGAETKRKEAWGRRGGIEEMGCGLLH